ncbi:hypothetical protein Tco_0982115, partial [Tanacetum coccineum]
MDILKEGDGDGNVPPKHLRYQMDNPYKRVRLCLGDDLKKAQDHSQRQDEEEVSDEEEMTQVKVFIALADDELAIRKNHTRN